MKVKWHWRIFSLAMVAFGLALAIREFAPHTDGLKLVARLFMAVGIGCLAAAWSSFVNSRPKNN